MTPSYASFRLMAALVLLAASAAGCSRIGVDSFASALITPDKYEYHSCEQVRAYIRDRRGRMAELEKLMAKSSESFGGELVNAMAYRTEYVQARGDLEVAVKAAQQKQCATDSRWSSERAIF